MMTRNRVRRWIEPSLAGALYVYTVVGWASHLPQSLGAQTLIGTTGLISVPTAEMPADGALTLGMTVMDRRYHGYTLVDGEEHAALVHYATLGFLPFVEVGLRLMRLADVPKQALGDRMVGVRVRPLREGAYLPAVVVGSHDLVGTRDFRSTYVVLSKHLDTVRGAGRVGVHAGYGAALQGRGAYGRRLYGAFGGISAEPLPWLALLAEHDAEQVSAGVRVRLLGRVTVLGAAHARDGYSGGIGYTHPLH